MFWACEKKYSRVGTFYAVPRYKGVFVRRNIMSYFGSAQRKLAAKKSIAQPTHAKNILDELGPADIPNILRQRTAGNNSHTATLEPLRNVDKATPKPETSL